MSAEVGPVSNALETPAARLSRSREQLRLSLGHAPPEPGDGGLRPARAAAQTGLDALTDIPGVAILVAMIRRRWSGHPLRAVATVAAGAATTALKPLAARHPWGLVAGALVLGGLLVWAAPWRRPVTSALFAGMLPQLLLALVEGRPSRPPGPAAD